MISPEVTRRARLVLQGMTLEEKCAQTMMVSYGLGPELPPEFGGVLAAAPVGAVLLLGYNIADEPEGIAKLTASLAEASRAAGAGVPVFIAVDHEGGTVYRLGKAGTRLPGASAVGAALEAGMDPALPAALYRNGAEQLALLGISVNLAPVLEPLNGENRDFLRLRSFSSDPRMVSVAGRLFIDAMRDGGILAVGKHFPGSGDGDPHANLPLYGFDLADPDHPQILPFREAISPGGLAAVMTSHVRAPALDRERPVTLSRKAQQEYLRNTLGFRGLILTDDINMKALSEGPPAMEGPPVGRAGGSGEAAPAAGEEGSGGKAGRTAAEAIAAGADMIMYLEKDIVDVHRALVREVRTDAAAGSLTPERLDRAVTRILEMKIALGLLEGAACPEQGTAPSGGRKSFSAAAFGELKKEGDLLLRTFRAFPKAQPGVRPGSPGPDLPGPDLPGPGLPGPGLPGPGLPGPGLPGPGREGS